MATEDDTALILQLNAPHYPPSPPQEVTTASTNSINPNITAKETTTAPSIPQGPMGDCGQWQRDYWMECYVPKMQAPHRCIGLRGHYIWRPKFWRILNRINLHCINKQLYMTDWLRWLLVSLLNVYSPCHNTWKIIRWACSVYRGNKLACNPRPHAITQRVLAQQKKCSAIVVWTVV